MKMERFDAVLYSRACIMGKANPGEWYPVKSVKRLRVGFIYELSVDGQPFFVLNEEIRKLIGVDSYNQTFLLTPAEMLQHYQTVKNQSHGKK